MCIPINCGGKNQQGEQSCMKSTKALARGIDPGSRTRKTRCRYCCVMFTKVSLNFMCRPTSLHEGFHESVHSYESSRPAVTKYNRSKHVNCQSGPSVVPFEDGKGRPKFLGSGDEGYIRAARCQNSKPQSYSPPSSGCRRSWEGTAVYETSRPNALVTCSVL